MFIIYYCRDYLARLSICWHSSMCSLTEGEDAITWLNDTGYGHLASKIEGPVLLPFVKNSVPLMCCMQYHVLIIVCCYSAFWKQVVNRDAKSWPLC